MKDLGMDLSRKSTHYLITMTTFANHSLAETWNFVASVTGTQVFTCAMNFKLYVKSTVKKQKEKHFSLCLHSYRKLSWYKMCHSAFPFSPQSLHAGRGSPLVPCPCYRAALTEETLQGKPLAAKTQEKQEQNHHLCSALLPKPVVSSQSGGDWAQCLGKAPFPKENLLSPFQSVQCPSVPVIPHFPTVRGCTAPPACWNWKNTAQGKCSHVCIALNNQDQAVSGIKRAMGSSQLWTISWNEHPSAVSGWKSLLERDSVRLQQSTVHAEIVTEKYYAVFGVVNLFLHVLYFMLNITFPYRSGLAKSFRFFR